MRDKRFIAEHRGGTLSKQQHIQLIKWACKCAEHVSSLDHGSSDSRLSIAISTAHAWTDGKASVGEARKAALGAFSLAKETPDKTLSAIARSYGHAVATAHMADHSLGAADYTLKAIKLAGRSVDNEIEWQEGQLDPGIRQLVISGRQNRKGLIQKKE